MGDGGEELSFEVGAVPLVDGPCVEVEQALFLVNDSAAFGGADGVAEFFREALPDALVSEGIGGLVNEGFAIAGALFR